MFSNKKEIKNTDDFDDVDIKMWSVELVLNSYMNGKQDKTLTKEDVIKVIEFSNLIVGFVHYDILPEEIDDEV